jgi:DNA-binding NarL/FixJ family response regulator
MIRILIVDDHPVVREGLVAVLEGVPDMRVVGSAQSAEEALAAMKTVRPDVVLLDLELPGMSGIDAIPRVIAGGDHVRVIVLTAYDTEERVLAAIRAGAGGYLLKGAAAAEIVHAIRAVREGGSYLTPRVATQVMAQVSGRGRSTVLSEREREVLRLIAQGQSNKQIGRQLSITERTVKFHVTSIFNKLGTDNRAQAIAVAARRGLL